MLKSSPMLRSVYSRVKKPLRNTPSKYKTINKRRKGGIEGIGIGEGKRGKHKGRTHLRNTPRL
jgi:hypothetical protein